MCVWCGRGSQYLCIDMLFYIVSAVVDPALGATEVDLMKVVTKHKGEDIILTPQSFNNRSSYDFQSSDSVYALVRL